jgi:hypothetical protein
MPTTNLRPGVVKRGNLYPIADGEPIPGDGKRHLTRAEWTGEHRPPRRGEWFLSGAIPEAYLARHDQYGPALIARLRYGRVVFD